MTSPNDDPGVITMNWLKERLKKDKDLSNIEKDRVREYYGVKKEMFEKDKVRKGDFKEVLKLCRKAVDDLHS